MSRGLKTKNNVESTALRMGYNTNNWHCIFYIYHISDVTGHWSDRQRHFQFW